MGEDRALLEEGVQRIASAMAESRRGAEEATHLPMAMPGMTGTELSHELLSIRADIPIILCSGYSPNVDEQKAKDIGIREYIMKPFTKKKLARLIRKALGEL